MPDAFWIILAGALVAVSGALLGSFLVLRKMAMVGDAISHAVLPGIVVAFMFTGSLNSVPMLIGAAATGLLATFIIESLSKAGKLQNDASIGLTFTFLFAVGIILISSLEGVDLDLDCVLYGEITYLPFDLSRLWVMGFALLIVIVFVVLGFKGLKLTTFDSALAAAMGVNVILWHYLLMGAVSLFTVTAFESVGAILVVAFLTGPAATAYLLTDDLKKMLVIAAIAGILASISGYYLAWWIDGSISAAMAVTIGVEFMLAFLFSPSHGLWRRKFGKQQVVSE